MSFDSIIILVLISIGIWFFYLIYKIVSVIIKINASKTWVQTIGTVTDGQIKYSSSGKGGTRYRAEIQYSYKVFGAEYNGKFKLDSFWRTKGAAERNCDEHPIGSSLTVRYNPEKPQIGISVFDKVSVSDVYNLAIITIVAGVFLYGFLILGLK